MLEQGMMEGSRLDRSHTTNPTVTVIQHLGKKSIQTNRDSADVLRHIIKNVSSRLVGTIQSPAAVTNGKTFFFLPKKDFWFWEKREMDGTRKDTEDTTLVQSEEDMMCTIRALPFVTKLSPVGARNSHGHGYRVSLRCPSCVKGGWSPPWRGNTLRIEIPRIGAGKL